MRFLCISDIHGHADALAAVLATAERRGFSKLLVAGDLCFPGPLRSTPGGGSWPPTPSACRGSATAPSRRSTSTTSAQRASTNARGSTASAPPEASSASSSSARLAKLPKTHRITIETGGEILLVHGSPLDPSEPFSHDMTDEELNALIGDEPADLIVCGASHVPFDRQVGDTRIVNVGSVGEAPGGHHAHATFLETSATGVTVEQFVVPLGRAA